MPTRPFVVENDIEKGSRGIESFQKLSMQKSTKLDYDIAVCGGSRGIFYAMALQLQGHRVCLIEAAELGDRDEEWNTSMDELDELVKLGVLSEKDIDDAIRSEFPGSRIAFKNKELSVEGGYSDNGVGVEFFAEGVSNVVVSQYVLVNRVSERFQELGGVILEKKPVSGIFVVGSLGAALDIGRDQDPLTARLVLDAMGTKSPITRQQREGTKPDGVCVVVGCRAAGYNPATNLVGDAIYSNSPIQDKMLQYFWGSYPGGIGRNGKQPGESDLKTTYLYTYMDAHQKRPSLESLMEDYWKFLPQYQPSIENPETDLDVQRIFFGCYPTYKDSPLPPIVDRVLAVGDAAGFQSPLSYGGLSCVAGQLKRVSDAVTEAIKCDMLMKEDLAEINSYSPGLRASWMFQKAMSVKLGQLFVDPRFVNRLLATNMEAMGTVDTQAIQPFLGGSSQFDRLLKCLLRSAIADPTIIPGIISWIGIPTFVDGIGHLGMMGTYALLDNLVGPLLRPVGETFCKTPESKYHLHRKLDSWKYGSGKNGSKD
jgi:flavin-dependent dehydrogenase